LGLVVPSVWPTRGPSFESLSFVTAPLRAQGGMRRTPEHSRASLRGRFMRSRARTGRVPKSFANEPSRG
jgi:hypothetical protein